MDTVNIDVRALLGELRERGGQVSLAGDSFSVRPAGAVTAELAIVLREYREKVVAYLDGRPTWPCSGCGNHCFPTPGTTCYWCQKKRAGLQTRPSHEGEQPSIQPPMNMGEQHGQHK